MRLISQDGTTDVFYEKAILYIEHHKDTPTHIWANDGTGHYIMGEYSTKEKALKVMEMLQQAYLGRNEALDLEMAEGTDEELKNIMLRQGFGTLFVTRTNNNPQAEFRPLHTYFKFPADEEVEVCCLFLCDR